MPWTFFRVSLFPILLSLLPVDQIISSLDTIAINVVNQEHRDDRESLYAASDFDLQKTIDDPPPQDICDADADLFGSHPYPA